MTPDKIVQFWFEEARAQWFIKDEKFDQVITERFGETYRQAARGSLDGWADSQDGTIALVIVLDQFSRNMFRGSAQSFATDEKALHIAKAAVQNGLDLELAITKRKFLYMPFMHSENLDDQNMSVELFKQVGDRANVEYAIRHRDIVAQFGRFPHRNKVLGRSSTLDEEQFLLQPGSSF